MVYNKIISKIIIYTLLALFIVLPATAFNLSEDFVIDAPDTLRFAHSGDREYLGVRFENNNISDELKCISYIAENTTEKYIIQTNPTYTNKSQATLNIFGSRYENREFFTIKNRIGKVYVTKENLIIDGRPYIVGVECSVKEGRMVAEKIVNVQYENIDSPITRFVWVDQNIFPIILGLVLFVIIITVIIIGVKIVK